MPKEGVEHDGFNVNPTLTGRDGVSVSDNEVPKGDLLKNPRITGELSSVGLKLHLSCPCLSVSPAEKALGQVGGALTAYLHLPFLPESTDCRHVEFLVSVINS
jgi:hypothetical protein